MKFFEQQIVDEAGRQAVRIQKILIGMALLFLLSSLLAFPMSLIAYGLEVALLATGFYASFKRNSQLLRIYNIISLVLAIIATVATILFCIVTFVALFIIDTIHNAFVDDAPLVTNTLLSGFVLLVIMLTFLIFCTAIYDLLTVWSMVEVRKLRSMLDGSTLNFQVVPQEDLENPSQRRQAQQVGAGGEQEMFAFPAVDNSIGISEDVSDPYSFATQDDFALASQDDFSFS